MAVNVRLNSDLGEGLDDIDSKVMPLIDMANIACGGHAGDDTTMQSCIDRALEHQVAIGAHPGYPDKANFGRQSLTLSVTAFKQTLLEQISSLVDYCQARDTDIAYIKPHGALYHDLMQNYELLGHFFELMHDIPSVCQTVMLQAIPQPEKLHRLARDFNITLLYEGFIDRAYTDQGWLVSRQLDHAVHSRVDDILQQASTFIEKHGVFSENQHWIPLQINSLCVHGDTPLVYQALCHIREQFFKGDA